MLAGIIDDRRTGHGLVVGAAMVNGSASLMFTIIDRRRYNLAHAER